MARAKRGTRRRRTQRTRRMRKTMRGGMPKTPVKKVWNEKSGVTSLRGRNVPRTIYRNEIIDAIEEEYGAQPKSVYDKVMERIGSKKFLSAALAVAYVASQFGAQVGLS